MSPTCLFVSVTNLDSFQMMQTFSPSRTNLPQMNHVLFTFKKSRLRYATDATIASFAFVATTVATFRNQFQFLPHRTNVALVLSSVTDIDFYISNI